MNSFAIRCPACQQAMTCTEATRGHRVRCSACQAVVLVPDVAPQPVAAAPLVSPAPRPETDDLIHFTCATCGKRLKAKSENAGRRVQCSCGETPTVPVVGASQVPPAAWPAQAQEAPPRWPPGGAADARPGAERNQALPESPAEPAAHEPPVIASLQLRVLGVLHCLVAGIFLFQQLRSLGNTTYWLSEVAREFPWYGPVELLFFLGRLGLPLLLLWVGVQSFRGRDARFLGGVYASALVVTMFGHDYTWGGLRAFGLSLEAFLLLHALGLWVISSAAGLQRFFFTGGAERRLAGSVSKFFYFTAVAMAFGISDALIVGAQCAERSVDPAGLAIVELFGAIVNLVLWYKMWAAIRDGYARTTPGKAIGFLFIPVYNLYWFFQAIAGFPEDYNRFLQRHAIRARPLPKGLFLAYCILTLVGSIPVVGTIFLLANYAVMLVMISKICDAVNAVALSPRQLPPPGAPVARPTAGQRVAPPSKKPDQAISFGAAGLILVALRLLGLAFHLAREIGDVFWFIGSVGTLASLVGLVVCIIALFKASGRGPAILGIVLWCVFGLLALAHVL